MNGLGTVAAVSLNEVWVIEDWDWVYYNTGNENTAVRNRERDYCGMDWEHGWWVRGRTILLVQCGQNQVVGWEGDEEHERHHPQAEEEESQHLMERGQEKVKSASGRKLSWQSGF